MWLVVGLGNPGSEYAGTRHNLGWQVLEQLGRRWRIEASRAGFEARYGKGPGPAGQEVILLAPQTFMNLSGQSVLAAMQFFKIEPGGLIVVLDDLALPPGQIRLRAGGSAGGHKGLEDIIGRLGREDFGRVRIGIGSPPPGRTGRDYVLSRPSPEERNVLEEAVRQAADAVECWIAQGAETAMNRYNRPRQTDAGREDQKVDPGSAGIGRTT